MRLLLNIAWFLWGGWLSGLLWLLGGVILAITIVGLPWASAAFRIAGFVFWPYGKRIVSRSELGHSDIGTGAMGAVGNVIWFVFAGWYIALSHLIIAVSEVAGIITIPFALKDLQLAGLALAPIGKEVVDV